MRYRPLMMMRTRGLKGPLFCRYGNKQGLKFHPVGNFTALSGFSPGIKDFAFVAAYHAETDQQNTLEEGNVMNLMPKGTITATSVHNAPIYAPDKDGVYREYPIDAPVWKGGTWVGDGTVTHDGLPTVYAQANKAATNLALWSSGFDDGVYTYTNSSPGAIVSSPLGSTSGRLIILNTVNDIHKILNTTNISHPSGNLYLSVFVKDGGVSNGALIAYNGTTDFISEFDLSTGTISTGDIEYTSDGWYRVSMSIPVATATTAWSSQLRIGDPVMIGNGIDGMYVSGFQNEDSSILSLPIPTTIAVASIPALDYVYPAANINPADTKFGTKIDYEGDDTVVMDIGGHKLLEIGDFAGNGVELVANGDFSNGATSWSASPAWDLSAGDAACDGTEATAALTQIPSISMVTGEQYYVGFDIVSRVQGSFSIQLGGGGVSSPLVTTVGSHEYLLTAGDIAVNNQIRLFGNGSFLGSVDNISVQKVAKVLKLSDGTNELTHPVSETSHVIYVTLDATSMQLEVDGSVQSGPYVPIAAGLITVSEDHFALRASPLT